MYEIYITMYGDNLSSIADKFSISVEELERINGKLDTIVPGMQIVVPKSNRIPFNTYVVKQGDTIYDIARESNLNPKYLLMINGLNENDFIYPNQELIIPKPGYGIYITNNDDSLNSVSSKLGVSVSDILAENGTIYLMPDQLIIYKKEKTI